MMADIDTLIIDGYIRPIEKQLKYFNIIPYTINKLIYEYNDPVKYFKCLNLEYLRYKKNHVF